MDLSLWMLKGSILTSGINSKRISFQQNTSTISQTPSGPLILMVYYATSDTSMFLCVLQYLHDHPLAGHFGQTKMLHQVHMHYYWPRLPSYIKDYCKSCTTCSHAKPVCHKPYGIPKASQESEVVEKSIRFVAHRFGMGTSGT